MWQYVQLYEQIRHWDTLAYGWYINHPTNQPTNLFLRMEIFVSTGLFYCSLPRLFWKQSTHTATDQVTNQLPASILHAWINCCEACPNSFSPRSWDAVLYFSRCSFNTVPISLHTLSPALLPHTFSGAAAAPTCRLGGGMHTPVASWHTYEDCPSVSGHAHRR